MSLKNSRFVHILAETAPSNIETHQREFVDRISDIAGLRDTISLRTLHETFGTAEFGAGNISVEATKSIREDFFQARALLVRSIAMSFISKSRQTANPYPTPERIYSHLGANPATGPLHSRIFALFRNFYTARQGDIESGISRLRFHCGNMLSEFSNELACLVQLDKSFSSMVSKYARNCFSAVPELLEAQFRELFDEQIQKTPEKITIADLKKWMDPNGWIFDFGKKMREMLLAELETRLFPLQGLIESLPYDYRE